MPQDYSVVGSNLSAKLAEASLNLTSSPDQNSKSAQAAANRVSLGHFATLSRYLCHRRWVWSVQVRDCQSPISMQAIGRVLSTITK